MSSDAKHGSLGDLAREHVTDSAPESRSDPNPHSDADTGNISHGASGDIDSIPVDLPALAQTPDGAGTGRDVDDTGRGWDQDVDVCHGVTDDDVTGILKGVGGGGGGVGGSPSNIDQKQSLNNGSSPASNAPAGTRTMESVGEAVGDVNKHMDLDHVYT